MKKMILFTLCFTLIFAACKSTKGLPDGLGVTPLSSVNTTPSSSKQEQAVNEQYPVEQNGAYPIERPDFSLNAIYPIPTKPYLLPEGANMGPDFRIDRPVSANASTVTGVGPAGVPIVLIDISELGKVFGEVVIGDDGRFKFSVSEGLIRGHQIALQLGDVTGTDLAPLDFVYNPNYSDRYLLGVLFDIVVIED